VVTKVAQLAHDLNTPILGLVQSMSTLPAQTPGDSAISSGPATRSRWLRLWEYHCWSTYSLIPRLPGCVIGAILRTIWPMSLCRLFASRQKGCQ
jgi:hypothetical protein